MKFKNYLVIVLLALIALGYNACDPGFKSKSFSSSSSSSNGEPDNQPPSSDTSIPDVGSLPLPGVEPVAIPETELGNVVKNMTSGTWKRLPVKNDISDVYPQPNNPNCPQDSPGSVVGAWSGGAASDEALYIFGGGHADYCGNELYRFNFSDLSWQRITEPSAYKECPSGACETVDGTPTSVHSYDAVQWIPYLNSLWAGPGSGWKGGQITTQSFLFSVDKSQWTPLERVPIKQAIVSEYDPVTGLILIGSRGGTMTALDPLTGEYYKSGKYIGPTFGFTSASFDFHRRLFISLNKTYLALSDLSQVNWEDTSSPTPAARVQFTYAMQGEEKIEFYPPNRDTSESGWRWGLIYDPRRQLFLAWEGYGEIWMLDPESWVWTKVQDNTIGDLPQARSGHKGIFGRWQYLNKYDVYLGYPSRDQSLWVFKP